VAVDGVLTGRLEGGNVRGEGKLARLAPLLDGEVAPRHLIVYGDSTGDVEMLGRATAAVWCGRRAPLVKTELVLRPRRSSEGLVSGLTQKLESLLSDASP
jgi:phosphoserine phosphatase